MPFVVPNMVLCGHDTLVMSFPTVFEGSEHHFGITACSDNLIYVGVRPGVYFEFNSSDLVSFINREACPGKNTLNYIFLH
jgi:hypothetical protein